MADRVAVLFLTHRWNAMLRRKFERLLGEVGSRADVFVVAHLAQATRAALRRLPPPPATLLLFDPALLVARLGYPTFEAGKLVPGSTHFPMLAFARRQPEYASLLVVEFDVESAGHWGELLDTLVASAADFVSAHFRTYPDDPDWDFWSGLVPADADREWAANERNRKLSFNPIYFISRRALELVDAAHRNGWRGHYENILATVLARAGCRMVELGELGLCVGREQDPVPGAPVDALATIRWRPEVTPDEFLRRSTGRTLFHPVKGPWFYDGSQIVMVKP